MRIIYIAFSCCLIGLVSCNNSGTGDKSNAGSTKTTPPALPAQSKLGTDGTEKVMSVITQYYALKNALVASKAARADSAATQLITVADGLQTFLQKDSANVTILKPYVDTIIMQAKKVSVIQDGTCEKQRLAFGTLSSAMYGLLKNVDLKNATVYREHCPMAFNEKGADWLSDDSDIKNPYFGKKMLECGEVTDIIK